MPEPTKDPEQVQTDWAALARAMRSALLLEFEPVAITQLFDEEAYGAFPAPEPHTPIGYCAAMREVAEGSRVKLAFHHMACNTSTRFLGMEPGADDPEFIESYAEGGLYRDHDVTKALLGDVAILEPLYGLGLVPLAVQPGGTVPDVVVVMTEPHGAMRLAQAAGFLGMRMGQQTIGMHGMCAETTAAPIVRDEVCLSLLCSGARHSGGWPDTMLSVGVPGSLLHLVVQGLNMTAERFEPDRRKERIIGSDESFGHLTPGSAYFLE